MYLKYITDAQINRFIKSLTCPNANTIIVPSAEREFINIFTDSLKGTFNITDFECINIETGKIYSREWRKFAISALDKIEQGLGDQYIDGLHDYLEQDTIVGSAL